MYTQASMCIVFYLDEAMLNVTSLFALVLSLSLPNSTCLSGSAGTSQRRDNRYYPFFSFKAYATSSLLVKYTITKLGVCLL